MTTSDERREAAELMRSEAAGFRRLSEEYDSVWAVDLGDVPAIFQDITHYVGLDGVVHADVIFDRIADFIDPTCTVVSERVHTGGFGCEEAGYEFTLSCGHTVIVDGEFPPSYCDECGARVVDDE